jgi:hypothetical protein
VFISYSTLNKAVADAVCARLEARGCRCWVAPRDIPPGTEWGEAIIDGIRGARIFVLIFSAGANASPQVRREVERAVGHGLPVLPFRIEDVVPAKSLEYFISNQHWLDALSPPLEHHIDRLAEAVTRQLGTEAERQPPPPSQVEVKHPKRRAWKVALAALLAFLVLGSAAWWAFGRRADAPVEKREKRSSSDKETAQWPEIASSPPPQAPFAASDIVGTWSGVVLEPRSAERPQYPIALRVETDGAGRLVGTVNYATFPCNGVWNLEEREGRTLRFRETIISGREVCAQDAVAKVELTPGGQFLQLEIYPAGHPDDAGRGTLNREAP